MDKNLPLKNILQKENWESISKAPERMSTNKDDSLRPLEKASGESETSKSNEEALQHNMQKLKEVIDSLERVTNNKINQQTQIIDEIVERLNRLVQNNNDFEIKLNKIDSMVNDVRGSQKNMKEFSQKKENSQERPRGESKPVKNTSTMENETNADDVAIEKIFNFSNKKFN